jgi:hypothetical protein
MGTGRQHEGEDVHSRTPPDHEENWAPDRGRLEGGSVRARAGMLTRHLHMRWIARQLPHLACRPPAGWYTSASPLPDASCSELRRSTCKDVPMARSGRQRPHQCLQRGQGR